MIRTLFILFSLTVFISCEERIALENDKSHSLLVECELNPSEQITAKVSELNNFDDISKDSKVSDAIIRMYTGIDEEITFTYDPVKNEYFVPKALHTARVGQKYNIQVTRESDLDTKFSTQTIVPSPQKMSASVSSFTDLNPGELVGKKTIKLNCAIPEAGEFDFFLLKVFIQKNYKLEQLKFGGNTVEPLAFQESSIDGAIMMDVNRVNKKSFDLNFTTPTSLKPNDKVTRLYYTLSSITEATYRYRISKHNQNKSFINSSVVPVTTYTNFDKGYGYLGACTSISDTISLK